RLVQHFVAPNKDRSIFRKNIGRCLLNQDGDPFLTTWNLDLTSRKSKQLHKGAVDSPKQQAVEKRVSQYIQERFSFTVIPVQDKAKRLEIESKLVSTVSLCQHCGPSKTWLGLSSPIKKIRESGLWQVNELYKTPFSNEDLPELQMLLG
ncbi:MAG: hypothetical protein KDA71_08245, partial [Planctomycetales bacterium]|nr:hypothetical protein [Planctomycetales bacterium]